MPSQSSMAAGVVLDTTEARAADDDEQVDDRAQ